MALGVGVVFEQPEMRLYNLERGIMKRPLSFSLREDGWEG